MQKQGQYVARLTVVDRYGRADSESREFEAWTLVNSGYYNEWSGAIYSGSVAVCGVYLIFETQNGTSVSGHLHGCEDPSPFTGSGFTGTVDAEGQVRLQLAAPQRP